MRMRLGRMAGSCLLLLLSGTAASETVQDLRYGVTLYHFFQQDYFSAISELMVAEETGQLPHHADQASLLKGGMSLSYGLDRDAEVSFQQWLTDWPKQPSERWQRQHQRAWFYLGKLNYQRGEDERALAALKELSKQDNQSSKTSTAIQQESLYLRSKILLNQGQFEQAEALAQQLPKDSQYLPYYWFNRGSQLAAVGDWSAAARAYTTLNQLNLTSDIDKMLRDRALTAAGFARLQLQQIDSAIDHFSQVRLNSPMADRALLGLGWAHLQTENAQAALAPWQQLRQQSLLQTSVQEVFLALPYAYEQLEADAAALREYEFARGAFEQEIQQLMVAIQSYQQQPMAELFGFDVSLNSDWLIAEEIQPTSDKAPYLSHLFARHRFQSAVKDFRDLINLQRYLVRAEERLQILNLVDTEQQLLWNRIIDDGAVEEYQQRYQQLVQAAEEIDQRIILAQADKTGRALADQQGLELWQLIEQSEQRIQTLLAAGESTDFEQEQLRRFRGLLVWQDSEQFPNELWQLRKARAELSTAIEACQQQLTSLQQTVANRQQSAFAPRIAELVSRNRQQQNNVQNQLAQQEASIRQLAITELQQQQQQLQSYLGKAKLSIARLYDKHSKETEQ